MSQNFDVLVFGSSIIDFICYVPRLPQVGETLHGHRFCVGYGGKGANQCVAATKLGAKTVMITKLGDDSWGQDYLQNFKDQGVNTDYVEKIKNETTGIAQITVDDSGNNNIVIITGANKLLSPQDVTSSLHLFKNSKVLVCQLETSLDSNIAALKAFKGISILNAAPGLENIPKDLITLPSIFCVNEVEASLITGIEVSTLDDAKNATFKLIEFGAKTVIITLGKKGAIYSTPEEVGNSDNLSTPEERKVIHVNVKKVDKVIDTTGAGDAFIGSLAYYIAKYPNLPFHQKIGAACEIAAISVQSPGTQKSFPHGNDIQINFGTQRFEWSFI